MKKLFILLAVASLGFVSCNNSADADAEKKRVEDSTHTADSLKKVADDAAAAAKAAQDTMNKMTQDTLKK